MWTCSDVNLQLSWSLEETLCSRKNSSLVDTLWALTLRALRIMCIVGFLVPCGKQDWVMFWADMFVLYYCNSTCSLTLWCPKLGHALPFLVAQKGKACCRGSKLLISLRFHKLSKTSWQWHFDFVCINQCWSIIERMTCYQQGFKGRIFIIDI